MHGMVGHEVDAFGTRKHFERPCDGDGYDGKLQFVSQEVCPFLEASQAAGVGARTFRKDDERCAVLQCGACPVDGFFCFSG